MPKYEMPVDLALYIKADNPAQAYGLMHIWFTALQSGDFEKFLSMRQDGTIFPSSWNVDTQEIKELMAEGIESQRFQKQLDEQRLNWKIDESGRRLIQGEDE